MTTRNNNIDVGRVKRWQGCFCFIIIIIAIDGGGTYTGYGVVMTVVIFFIEKW